jgi:16S rRNA (cytosine1402-N4)-methyltransferase
VGGGGHTSAILERLGEDGRLLGIDRDPEALEAARRRLGEEPRATLVHGDYRDLTAIMKAAGFGLIDGLLADLGVSTMQLDGPGRGFSFRRDEPLDMRMDRSGGRTTASEWLACQDEASLERVLREWGEEHRFGRRIARALMQRQREEGMFRTTGELAATVRKAIPGGGKRRIDPATKTFQAIRIAVNDELRNLGRFVEDAVNALETGGRLVVISFHSLEDREIKHALRRLEGECTCPRGLPICACEPLHEVAVLTRRAVRPGEAEVAANPRSRSARLRAAERLERKAA